ncbi:hypothetical protein FRC00_011706 [Tulasnella sp. 408]|nr:hypothetical protein FRC00_011706 [Tulasnella sp. 408]
MAPARRLPPVVSEGYEKKGEFISLGSLEKAYVTGPKETGRAIVVVYDVIGYSSQTIQGADILAWSANAQVIVPDLLQGDFADHSWIPPDTPEKLQRWQRWYAERGDPLTYLEPLASVAAALRNGGAQKIGLCDAFMKALESKPFAAKNDRKRYDTMHHGWAAARGDLNDEQNLKEFQDVYGRIATFIDKIFDQK